MFSVVDSAAVHARGVDPAALRLMGLRLRCDHVDVLSTAAADSPKEVEIPELMTVLEFLSEIGLCRASGPTE